MQITLEDTTYLKELLQELIDSKSHEGETREEFRKRSQAKAWAKRFIGRVARAEKGIYREAGVTQAKVENLTEEYANQSRFPSELLEQTKENNQPKQNDEHTETHPHE